MSFSGATAPEEGASRPASHGASHVWRRLPVDGDRAEAAAAIARAFARLLDGCPRPGCLFVTGGETLRAVASALGAGSLAVEGALEPGLPFSRLVGGRFDRTLVVSQVGRLRRA